jgi:hypothetical protein
VCGSVSGDWCGELRSLEGQPRHSRHIGRDGRRSVPDLGGGGRLDVRGGIQSVSKQSGTANIRIRRDSFFYPNTQVSALNSGVKFLTPTEGYHDGVARSLSFTGWSGTPARDFSIGARHVGDTSWDGFFNGTIQAAWFGSSAPNATQVAAISAAMAALTNP